MSTNFRKGFKFVKIDKVEPTSENISFDKLVAEPTISSLSNNENSLSAISGRKRKIESKPADELIAGVENSHVNLLTEASTTQSKIVKSRSDDSFKASTAALSNSSSSAASSNELSPRNISLKSAQSNEFKKDEKKAYYPKVLYELSSSFKSLLPTNHKDILNKILIDICEKEKAALVDHFKDNNGRGSIAILKVLEDILTEIPMEISRLCPAKAEYKPEYTSSDKSIKKKLLDHVNKLTDYDQLLSKYEEDASLLSSEFGIWSHFVEDSSGSENLVDSTKDIVDQYAQLLADMESYCDTILLEADHTSVDMNAAKKSQELLFDVYKKASNNQSSSTSAKAIIKQSRKSQ